MSDYISPEIGKAYHFWFSTKCVRHRSKYQVKPYGTALIKGEKVAFTEFHKTEDRNGCGWEDAHYLGYGTVVECMWPDGHFKGWRRHLEKA